MKYSFIAIILLLNIAFSTAVTTQQNVQQGKNLFRQLSKSSDIGRNLVETIQLELQTSSGDQTVVSKVIEMLKEVQQSLIDQRDSYSQEVQEKDEQCYSQVTDLKESIKELDTRIDEINDRIPLRKDEFEIKQSAEKEKQDELTFYYSEVTKLDAKAAEKKESYEAQNEEYDQLIAALQQAKRLIRTLKASFLQKNTPETNLAQVQGHFENSMKFVQQPHNRAFLKYLLQVSQVADQEQVQGLLEILDELIASTEQTQTIERTAENRRVESYNQKREQLKANVEQAEADLLEVQADIKSAQLRYKEAQENLKSSTESRDSKQQQLDDHRRSCEDQVSSLNSRIATFDDILDIIRQVLILLENSSIQSVDLMVSDIEGEGEQQQEEESILFGEADTSSSTQENNSAEENVATEFVQKQKSYLNLALDN